MSSSTVFVGRVHEVSALDHALDQAIAYQAPQTLFISGEQGIGKTRLISHWRDCVAKRSPSVRFLSDKAIAEDESLGVFRRLLLKRFAITSHDARHNERSVREQLERVVKDKRVTEFLHFLGSFIDLVPPENPFLQVFKEAPEQQHQIAWTVFRRFLELDAQSEPLVLIVDDFHLGDESSIRFTHYLIEHLQGAPVMMVVSFRPEGLRRYVQVNSATADLVKIELSPLSFDESVSFIGTILDGEPSQLPLEFLRAVVTQSGGSPFFIEELLRMICSEQILRNDASGWQIEPLGIDRIAKMVSVEDVVRARISALSANERELLNRAAAIGSLFWRGALVAVARMTRDRSPHERLNSIEDQVEIERMMQSLVERDYILLIPEASLIDEPEYVFKHNLERELLERSVSPTEFAQIHFCVAQWMRGKVVLDNSEQLELLAEHYRKANRNRDTATCYFMAADLLKDYQRRQKALALYRKGLEFAEEVDLSTRIQVYQRIGELSVLLGQMEAAQEAFQRALDLAWLIEHTCAQGIALRWLGMLAYRRGEYDLAKSNLETAEGFFRHVNPRPDRDIALTLSWLGQVYRDSGALQDALGFFDDALKHLQSIRDPETVADILLQQGAVYFALESFEAANRSWSEGLVIAKEVGALHHEAAILTRLGELFLQTGRIDDVIPYIERAIPIARQLNENAILVEGLRVFSETMLMRGDVDHAERLAQEGIMIAERHELTLQMALMYRTLAEIATMRPKKTDGDRDGDRAGDFFERAALLFDRLGNVPQLARTLANFADYCDRIGDWKNADSLRQRADQYSR